VTRCTGQRNALDSAFISDTRVDYSNPATKPVRWLAEGRDASATLDASTTPSGFGKNDGDNEITGLYASDGDPGKDGILGAKAPARVAPGRGLARLLYAAARRQPDV
jgi:hypothetical protein